MKEVRQTYGFSIDSKQFARERASGACEFPDKCPEPNTGRVNHLSGCGIADRLGLDPEPIKDPNLNAIMLCRPHEQDLDRQEAVILYELDHK